MVLSGMQRNYNFLLFCSDFYHHGSDEITNIEIADGSNIWKSVSQLPYR